MNIQLGVSKLNSRLRHVSLEKKSSSSREKKSRSFIDVEIIEANFACSDDGWPNVFPRSEELCLKNDPFERVFAILVNVSI